MVTQGTLIEPLSNDANYLMAIAEGPGLVSLGLAWLDVSTSHFEVVQCIVLFTCRSQFYLAGCVFT